VPVPENSNATDQSRMEGTVKRATFRMLMGVEGVGPHEEDTWLGRRVRAGGAAIVVRGNVGRRVITTLNPDTGVGTSTRCARCSRTEATSPRSTSSSSIPANVRTTTTIGGDGMQYTFALPPTCGAPLSSPPAGSCRRAGNSSARAAYVQMNRSPTILMRRRSLGSTVTCSQGGAGVKLSVSRREQPTSPTVPHGAPMRRGAARKETT
jgi:hypothetical protein